MTTAITIGVFLLGIVLGVYVVAALHGPLDYSYTIKTAYPKVILGIVIWCGMRIIAALLLGDYRPAFLWGLGAYGVFYLCSYLGFKLMIRRNLALLEKE